MFMVFTRHLCIKFYILFRYRKYVKEDTKTKQRSKRNPLRYCYGFLCISGGMKTCPYPLVPPWQSQWMEREVQVYIVAPALQKHRHCNGCALTPCPSWLDLCLSEILRQILASCSSMSYHGCTCSLIYTNCRTKSFRAHTRCPSPPNWFKSEIFKK